MMRNNLGNILRVIHEISCSLKIAEEALANCNS